MAGVGAMLCRGQATSTRAGINRVTPELGLEVQACKDGYTCEQARMRLACVLEGL